MKKKILFLILSGMIFTLSLGCVQAQKVGAISPYLIKYESYFTYSLYSGQSARPFSGYSDMVDVSIIWTNPSNVIITVIIKVDGNVVWVGGLKAGQSSPTINTGGYTEIIIRNDNAFGVDVIGSYTVYFY